MLDLGLVNLRSPAELLEDHSPETGWWFDPRSDDCDPFIDPAYADVEMEEESPWERGLVRIDTIPSREAYGDMEVFIGRVRDPRARDLLERAIAGRGAFRRFKDTLLEFPALRQAWFAFHDARMQRRAIRWLADQGLIEESVAEREVQSEGGPEATQVGVGSDPGVDPVRTAAVVAAELRAAVGGGAAYGPGPVAALLPEQRGHRRGPGRRAGPG